MTCNTCQGQTGGKAALSAARAPATMRGSQGTTGCRLAISATATLLVVVGSVLILLLLYEENRPNRVFYALRLLQSKQHGLYQAQLQQHHPRELRQHQQQQKDKSHSRHDRLPLPQGILNRGKGPSAGPQTGGDAAGVREAAVASTEATESSRSSTVYSLPALKKRRFGVAAAPSAISLYPIRYTRHRSGRSHLESSLLIEALSSSVITAKSLRLLPWNLCGPPLSRAPALPNVISSSRPASPSLTLSYLSSAAFISPLFSFTATEFGAEGSAAPYVSASAGSGKPLSSPPLPLHDPSPGPAATVATTPSRLPLPPPAAPCPSATLADSSVPAANATFLRGRRRPKTLDSRHRDSTTQQQRQHHCQDQQREEQQKEEPQEGRGYSSLSGHEEPVSVLPVASSSSFSSSPSSSHSPSGALSRRLTVADTLIHMGSQFIMYPEMGKMLEEQLGALKRAFRGESTADLKIPVYISAENDCLVVFDFVPDQENGDNYNLGRVSPGEIEISVSFAEHQGLLKYKERRQESMQVAKLPVVHLQRFELPKNCLSTDNAAWTAYCTAPAHKECYVGRVDLHLSSLGDEDALTFVAPIPFNAYVESQMEDGVTYSEILDRVEAPTPLLRMLFDNFRCLLHYRFQTVEPSSTHFFWLKNRQGIRIDVKDASTNTMTAKKTSIPPLCGAERPEDIQATWTELPDGSYKALVKFKRYFEYEKVYSGFVKIERKEPDRRPKAEFDYYNEEQLEFDKFFPDPYKVVPLIELPRVIEKQ